MKKVTKQVVGIDIGKDKFYACYKIKYQDGKSVIKGTTSFTNDASGMSAFYKWSKKRDKTEAVKPIFVMEATGIYYENLAYFLYNREEIVSVHLAQKLKYFAKSCNLKTKTDKVDSKMIAEFGIEKNLQGNDLWSPPSKEFKTIRDMAREHTSLKKAQTAAKLQLHAMKYSREYSEQVVQMKKEQIAFFSEQIKTVEKQMKDYVEKDKKLSSRIKKIEAIQGVGFITIIKVLTETNGFLLFNNIRQLVSYAGLDVVENESGNRSGKTKLSKKGNARLRTALYLPALSAKKHDKTLSKYYDRIMENRTIKKQGIVAVMRKLLILIYTIWKKDVEYIEDYQAMN